MARLGVSYFLKNVRLLRRSEEVAERRLGYVQLRDSTRLSGCFRVAYTLGVSRDEITLDTDQRGSYPEVQGSLVGGPEGDPEGDSSPPPSETAPGGLRLIEVGWLVLNKLRKPEAAAVAEARVRMAGVLRARFPMFDWRIRAMYRNERQANTVEEPVALLDEGIHERESRHLDFCIVLTTADLKSYYKSYALAAPSRAVSVAVLSLARLMPDESDEPHPAPDDTGEVGDVGEAARASKKPLGLQSKKATRAYTQTLSRRVSTLALHLLGDLNGLAHSDDPASYLYEPGGVSELDAMERFTDDDAAAMEEELTDVADVRLEERPMASRRTRVSFYMNAAWINRDDIFSAVAQAKPWEFPLRLSRLTTAAFSGLLVLLITAEVWDLGLTRPLSLVAGMSALSIVGTSAYILKRQRLLLRRSVSRMTEQNVVTNTSITVTVLLGMLTTYFVLFAVTLGLAFTLFAGEVVPNWATSLHSRGGVQWHHYLAMAGVVATMGIVVGALGASFEGQHYFRHVAYVDEET